MSQKEAKFYFLHKWASYLFALTKMSLNLGGVIGFMSQKGSSDSRLHKLFCL